MLAFFLFVTYALIMNVLKKVSYLFSFFYLLKSTAVQAEMPLPLAQTQNTVVVAELLLEIDSLPLTNYDFTRFLEIQKALKEAQLCKSVFTKYAQTDEESFFISKLSYVESEQLDIEADAVELKKALATLIFKSETPLQSEKKINEIKYQCQAVAFENLKNQQLKNNDQFKNWVSLLKRKYNVAVKSNDFKSKISY